MRRIGGITAISSHIMGITATIPIMDITATIPASDHDKYPASDPAPAIMATIPAMATLAAQGTADLVLLLQPAGYIGM
jgi:hypothetical protein